MSKPDQEPNTHYFELYPTIGHPQSNPASILALSDKLREVVGFSVKFKMRNGLPVRENGCYIFSTQDPTVARLLPNILERVYKYRCIKHRSPQDKKDLSLQLDRLKSAVTSKNKSSVVPGRVVPSLMNMLGNATNQRLFDHSEAVLMGGDRISYMYISIWIRNNPKVVRPAHYAVLLAEGEMDGVKPDIVEVTFPNARKNARKVMTPSGRIFSHKLMAVTNPNPPKPAQNYGAGSAAFFHP